jgi:hypothetical protein
MSEVFDQAEPGTVYALPQYQPGKADPREQFRRYLIRAGVTPWPRIFHNLRGSRETELMKMHPAHVVCSWIGNSELVAAKHFLQVTDEDFNEAVASASGVAQGWPTIQPTHGVPQSPTNEKSPGFPELCDYVSACGTFKYPLRESNPCRRTENPVS